MGQAHYTEGMTINTRGIPQTLDGQSNKNHGLNFLILHKTKLSCSLDMQYKVSMFTVARMHVSSGIELKF